VPSLVSLLLLVVLIPTAPATAAPRSTGDRVPVTGVVTDGHGRPLANLQVVLEGSRVFFNLRRLRRDERHPRRLAATTNERGEFSLEWLWDDFFNHFTLRVAVPVRTAQGEELRDLKEVDLTRRLEQQGPVVAAVTVEDTSFLEAFRDFLSTLDSSDERRIYREMGYPDKVDDLTLPDRTETAWWYFRRGQVVRFRDGQVYETGSFEPVERF
jgi:hypothetical protein